jgi:hypothetical protein
VKACIHLLSALLLVAPGAALAASHHAAKPAAAGQTWKVGRCSLTLPKGWSDHQGGKADPKDHAFNVTIGSASSAASLAATLTAMNGRTVSDGKDLAVLRVDLRRRGAQQYWAVTKSSPACRATITYPQAAQESAARKIAESLKRGG